MNSKDINLKDLFLTNEIIEIPQLEFSKSYLEMLLKQIKNNQIGVLKRFFEFISLSPASSFIAAKTFLSDSAVQLKEIVEESSYSQPAISQRSAQLEEMGLLQRRKGKENRTVELELEDFNKIIYRFLDQIINKTLKPTIRAQLKIRETLDQLIAELPVETVDNHVLYGYASFRNDLTFVIKRLATILEWMINLSKIEVKEPEEIDESMVLEILERI